MGPPGGIGALRSLVLGTLLCSSVALAAIPIPPAPSRWVTDGAGLLSANTTARLDGELEAYEQQSGHQIVVWIAPTLDGGTLDDWSVHTFAAWKLGRAGQDDGLAVFVFADDHAIDVEVGYGLEAVVPDLLAHRIISEVMAPALRAGDADGAITAGVDALVAAIEGHPVDLLGAPVTPEAEPLTLLDWVLGGVGALLFVFLLIRYPRLALWIFWSLSRGRGGGGGSDRRSGGGRSGGGGARGSW